MNAMQREELIRRTRKHEIDELLATKSPDASEEPNDDGEE